MFGDVRVPATVVEEVERGPADISRLEYAVEEVEHDTSAYPHLDPGETAAILLCVARDAVLLTDDLDARRTAADEGIEVHGSIGVVLYAYSHDELSGAEARRLLRSLERDTNLYLSTSLVDHAVELIESDASGW